MFEKVGRVSSNDMRAANEYALKQKLALGNHKLHPDALQHFLGHSKEISLKHYQAGSLDQIGAILAEALPEHL